jgi:hypothetical protein
MYQGTTARRRDVAELPLPQGTDRRRMMKPWWILAAGVLLAAGLAMVGCPGQDGRDADEEGEGGRGRSPALSAGMGGESGGRKASKRQRKEDDAAQAAIREKLKSIIIPKVDFEGTTLEESVDFLCLRMAELDPDPNLDPTQRGVKVGFRVAAGEDIFERPLSEWSSRRIRDIARDDAARMTKVFILPSSLVVSGTPVVACRAR